MQEFPSVVLCAFTVLFLKGTLKCCFSWSRTLLFPASCLIVTLLICASAWSRQYTARYKLCSLAQGMGDQQLKNIPGCHYIYGGGS